MRAETKKWKLTVLQVRGLLDDLDPYHLKPGQPEGAPADEYEHEASEITRQVLRDGSVLVDRVDAIWVRSFDEDLSAVVGRARAETLVAQVNALALESLDKAPHDETPA